MMPPSPDTLFDRIGRETAIMSAVTLFYDNVLADPELAPFFEGMDMTAQINKQIAFMTMAFNGPHEYTGRDLAAAHASMVAEKGLGNKHFDRLVSCLESSLQELSFEANLIEEVLQVVEGMRDDVLGRDASP